MRSSRRSWDGRPSQQRSLILPSSMLPNSCQSKRGARLQPHKLMHCGGLAPPHRRRRFQQEGVRKGLAFGGRCLIADEMGLGKTVQV